jgi:predicted RNA binding protein YcfA (HicA-like mRNA interferase family)
MKVHNVLERIQADGWILVATKGSHRQFKHPAKPGRVTPYDSGQAKRRLGNRHAQEHP